MIKHFAADGTVKREWPEGLHASPAVRDGKLLTQVQGSNAVLAEIELGDGEQVGEAFIPAIASALAAADVHPIESALASEVVPLSEIPVALAPEAAAVAAESAHAVIASLHSQSVPIEEAAPVQAIAGDTTEHHAPSPSEVVAAAAHALSDAAEVLKEEEAHQIAQAPSAAESA